MNAHTPNRPTQYLSCADTAKLIRKALKEAFPSVKFSVRSSTYSMGASIRVGYTDGPKNDDVEAVAKTFAGGYFAASTDYKGGRVHVFTADPTQPIHFGADFVFVTQEISAGHLAAAAAALDRLSPDELMRLDARLRIGEFATPWTIRHGDHAHTQAVAKATLPPIVPRPSPTAESVVLVRTY